MEQANSAPRKRIFSGIQPSGDLTLGSYMGAIKNWVPLQDEYDCIYCIVDMHAITVRQDPVLMAADILLYQADLVPVGQDQKQHVELCRDVAQRFNGVYSDTFTLPEPFIPKMGARVMSLGDPSSKMSKSDPDGCVFLMDAPEVIQKKFKRAVTDSETQVRFDPEHKPGISNLLTIYCAATGKSPEEAEEAFQGQGYGVFKPAVGDAVVELLRPIREEAGRLMADKAYLEGIYKEGAERASHLAAKTLRKVYKKVGFVAR